MNVFRCSKKCMLFNGKRTILQNKHLERVCHTFFPATVLRWIFPCHVRLGKKGPLPCFWPKPSKLPPLPRLANKTQAARAISKYNNRVPRLLERIFVLSVSHQFFGNFDYILGGDFKYFVNFTPNLGVS